MNVITLAQAKGGVGKSTLAINLACAAQRGRVKAVVIELDRQGTVSNWHGRRKKNAPEVRNVTGVNLSKALDRARSEGVDVVFIDLPGSHNPSTVWAIRASDYVLIPSRPTIADLEARVSTVRTLADESKQGAFVLTFTTPNASEAKEARKKLEASGFCVAPTTIRQHKLFPKADQEGCCVAELDTKSTAAIDVTALWKWLKDKVS